MFLGDIQDTMVTIRYRIKSDYHILFIFFSPADEVSRSRYNVNNDNCASPMIKRLLFDGVIVCAGILGKKNLPADEYDGYFQYEASIASFATVQYI